MTDAQFEALEDFIQAKIEYELALAFRRDPLQESIMLIERRKDLHKALGLPE